MACLMWFEMLPVHQKAAEAALKARWPDAVCGIQLGTFRFMVSIDSESDPFAIRDAIEPIAPEVRGEMAAIVRTPDGYKQLQV